MAYIDKARHNHPWERPKEFFQILHHFLEAATASPLRNRETIEGLNAFPGRCRYHCGFPGETGYPARTVNVSRQGLLLDFPEALGTGSEIEIVSTLNQNGEDLVIPGKIVRETRDEAGEGFRLGVDLLWPGGGPTAWDEFLASLALEYL